MKLLQTNKIDIQLIVLMLSGVLIAFNSSGSNRFFMFVPILIFAALISRVIFYIQNRILIDNKAQSLTSFEILTCVILILICGVSSDSFYYLYSSVLAIVLMQIFISRRNYAFLSIVFSLILSLFIGEVTVSDRSLAGTFYDSVFFWIIFAGLILLTFRNKKIYFLLSFLGSYLLVLMFSAKWNINSFSLTAYREFTLSNITLLYLPVIYFTFLNKNRSLQMLFGVGTALLFIIFNKLNISHSLLLSIFIIFSFDSLQQNVPTVKIGNSK